MSVHRNELKIATYGSRNEARAQGLTRFSSEKTVRRLLLLQGRDLLGIASYKPDRLFAALFNWVTSN